MKTISGILHPVTGSIEFAGEDISNMNAYDIVGHGISQVPEGRRLFPDMTVLENLRIGSYDGKARAVRQENLERVYDLFPILAERKNQVAKTLSGGQQQMVAIGRGLMSNPKLMIIDEMSLGLSPLIVLDLFKTLHEADRAYIIETGRIVLSGNALELAEEEKVKNAYFGA
jgi:branched-chain amino acid transport system ATP-binding protein